MIKSLEVKTFRQVFTLKSCLHLKGFDPSRLLVDPELEWIYAALTFDQDQIISQYHDLCFTEIFLALL